MTYLVTWGSHITEENGEGNELTTGEAICESLEAVRGMLDHDTDLPLAEIEHLIATGMLTDETIPDRNWIRVEKMGSRLRTDEELDLAAKQTYDRIVSDVRRSLGR